MRFVCFLLCVALTVALPLVICEQTALADNGVSTAAAIAYTGPYVKVGNTTLPLAEHMPGTYFTRNGKACTCHYTEDCIANGSGCNCMRYYPTGNKSTCEIDLMSVQCFGFARLVFYKCFGFIDQAQNADLYYNVGSLSRSQISESSVKALMLKAAPGAHVRLSQGHSVSILTMDSDFIVIYHGNAGGDGVASSSCIVSTRRYTWAEFARAVSAGIDYIHMPYNYPDSSLVLTEKKVGYYRITSEDGLRLRAEPNTQSGIYAVIPFNEIVKVTQVDQFWGKTTYAGETGWVFLEYTTFYTALKILPSGDVFKRSDDGYLRAAIWSLSSDSFSEYFDKQSIVTRTREGALFETDAYITTGATVSLVVDGTTIDTATVCIAGDINCNGILDVGDYIVARRAYFGNFKLGEPQKMAADVSGNGEIDSMDYVLIKRYFFTQNQALFDDFME